MNNNKIILEIRAGVGGDEANIFAKDLLRMYERYSESQHWQIKKINDSTLSISGENVFNKLKNEAGVHRVQRVPITEKAGRIHTSTATVAVLNEMQTQDIDIKHEDLIIETVRGSGPGGQNRNVRDTAVRIIHKPTGITVKVEDERSQYQNKIKAIEILKQRLSAIQKQKALQEQTKERREQIGQAERSEKIRTYNFPQNRVTDHRINKSWQNLTQILDGKLDTIIRALNKHERR